MDSIQRMADYYGLTPKPVRKLNTTGNGSAMLKGKCTVHLKDGFTFDGQPKAAAQLALNIISDPQARKRVGI